jgi:transposase-like protein
MLAYVQECSQKIRGPNKIVEIDESKFGRRKYNRGHPVGGQWVFGGVERDSGRTFFVPVPDRSAETLVAIIRDWIEPGTTVISDCWGAYYHLEEEDYTNLTVNHTIGFVDPETGAHTNTTECQWRHLKASLTHYNLQPHYIYQMAHYMFAARCKAENVDQFTKFLHLFASTDWSNSTPTTSSSSSSRTHYRLPHQQTTGTIPHTAHLQLIRVSALYQCFPLARITCCAGRHIDARPGAVPNIDIYFVDKGELNRRGMIRFAVFFRFRKMVGITFSTAV